MKRCCSGTRADSLRSSRISMRIGSNDSARASRPTKTRLLFLLVTEKTTLADDLRHLRWHHFIPALVAAGDALEHVTGKDRQIFWVEVIELHEAAAAHQVIIERLQVGFDLKRVNGF